MITDRKACMKIKYIKGMNFKVFKFLRILQCALYPGYTDTSRLRPGSK